MDIEYIPGDLVSVYVGVKKYIVEVIGTANENEALLYQMWSMETIFNIS